MEDLEKFRIRLLADLGAMIKRSEAVQPLLTSGQVRKLLNISPATLQKLRVNRKLPYIKLEGAFRYRVEDVERITNAHKS